MAGIVVGGFEAFNICAFGIKEGIIVISYCDGGL